MLSLLPILTGGRSHFSLNFGSSLNPGVTFTKHLCQQCGSDDGSLYMYVTSLMNYYNYSKSLRYGTLLDFSIIFVASALVWLNIGVLARRL